MRADSLSSRVSMTSPKFRSALNPVKDATFTAPKALAAMRSLGKRTSSVQLRVGAPLSQSSQRSSGFHKPAASGAAPETATILPPGSSLRVSFVRKSCRGSTGGRLQSILLL